MPEIKRIRQRAQVALEYILLLTVVAVVVFASFKTSTDSRSVLNRAQEASEGYYNAVTEVIMGKNPNPINGGLCPPKPSGERECACPAPAFGGTPCFPRGANIYCGDGTCNGTETCESGSPNTCFEDCGFCPDCTRCDGTDDVFVSTGCGAQCGDAGTCAGDQMCWVNDCATNCPGYTTSCRSDVSCGCVSDGTCAGTTPACGQTATGLDSCNAPCSIPGPDCCTNGTLDPGETQIDCGGSCGPCCTNVCVATSAPVCGMPTAGLDQGCGQPCTIPAVPCAALCIGTPAGAPCPGTAQAAVSWTHVAICPATSTCTAKCPGGQVPTGDGTSCSTCGNGTCESLIGETCSTCATDCGTCVMTCPTMTSGQYISVRAVNNPAQVPVVWMGGPGGTWILGNYIGCQPNNAGCGFTGSVRRYCNPDGTWGNVDNSALYFYCNMCNTTCGNGTCEIQELLTGSCPQDCH